MWGTRGRNRGRVPTWAPLGIVLVGILSLLRKLDAEASARGVAMVDVTRYRLHAGEGWVCDAWVQRLERLLARTRRIDATDRKAIDAFLEDLSRLSFVAEVGEPEVIWPDGLSVPIRLYEPVACLQVGDDYLPVAADGTVLAGYSYAPHPARGGFLPVLGPHGLDSDPRAPFQPGDRLTHRDHREALQVALSLWRYLDLDSLRLMGRAVIDASDELAFDRLPGGVHIDLEGARRIHFGRPPGIGQVGELPSELKWRNVAEGLARWQAGEEFDAFDARWDEPRPLRYGWQADGEEH